MSALVIKVNPLTYYNNYSTKEKCPNLHCYINLNNNSSLFKTHATIFKINTSRTCKSQTTYHYNNISTKKYPNLHFTWNTCCHIYIKMTYLAYQNDSTWRYREGGVQLVRWRMSGKAPAETWSWCYDVWTTQWWKTGSPVIKRNQQPPW